MLKKLFTSLWHDKLRRPYKLAVTVNEGEGQPVVFLHGIAGDYNTWTATASLLPRDHYHVIIPDLLGHGSSTKPVNNSYSASEHARQVLAMIRRLGVDRPVVLVGHSMGALVAVEVAKQKPDMVRGLVLCNMPIYETGKKLKVTSRTNTYFALYRLLINRPEFTLKSSALIMKALTSRVSFSLTKETWNGFKLSLENTIIKQTTYADIQRLRKPIILMRGKLDMLVPARPLMELAKKKSNIELIQVNQAHEVTKAYASLVAKEITTTF